MLTGVLGGVAVAHTEVWPFVAVPLMHPGCGFWVGGVLQRVARGSHGPCVVFGGAGVVYGAVGEAEMGPGCVACACRRGVSGRWWRATVSDGGWHFVGWLQSRGAGGPRDR